MALGIHVDTGSLIYEQSTPSRCRGTGLVNGPGGKSTGHSCNLLSLAYRPLTRSAGYLPRHPAGGKPSRATPLPGGDISAIAVHSGALRPGRAVDFPGRCRCPTVWCPITVKRQTQNAKLLVVGRARGRISQGAREQGVDLGELVQTHGGGGHATAASVSMTTDDPAAVMEEMACQRGAIAAAPFPPQKQES